MDGYAIDGRLSTSLEETIPSVNAHMWHSDHFAFLRLLMCYARLRLSGIVHKRDCIWAKFTSGKVDKMVVTDRRSAATLTSVASIPVTFWSHLLLTLARVKVRA
jgi:hypothetical protein